MRGQSKETHWKRSPTTFRVVEFQLEDVFLVIFILFQHGQRAQREGALHLGTTNGKDGTLNDGKTKNVGISDNLDNAKVYRPVQRDLYGDVRAKWSQLLPSFT